MKDDNALYGSPGADMVAMGDQVLQEDGGNMGGASSWDQFSNGRCHMYMYTYNMIEAWYMYMHSVMSRSYILC